jgi:hypothetical protein
VAFDEKAFFIEKPESRPAKYPCPRCKRTNEYSIRWMRRTKRKDRQPQGGEDRAKFDKLRDHLLRLDDEVTCKSCGKKFEVPSHHSLLFTDQLEGLPKDEEADDTAAEAPPEQPIDRAKLPARFTRPTKAIASASPTSASPASRSSTPRRTSAPGPWALRVTSTAAPWRRRSTRRWAPCAG